MNRSFIDHLLTWFSAIWAGLVGLLVAFFITFQFVTKPFLQAWNTVTEWFSPYNLATFLVTAILLSPAVGAILLRDYLRKKKASSLASKIMKEAGIEGSPEQFLKDFVNSRDIPQAALNLAGDFGEFIADLFDEEKGLGLNKDKIRIYPESMLPAPKDNIKEALMTVIETAKENETKAQALTALLALLYYFAPDEDVKKQSVLSEAEFENRKIAILRNVGFSLEQIHGPLRHLLEIKK